MRVGRKSVIGIALTLCACPGVSLGGSVVTPPGVFVLNQIGDVASYDLDAIPGPVPSQIFTDFIGYDCMILEDFTVEAGELEVLNVSALFRAQSGFTGFQNVQGYSLNFFSSPTQAISGLSGDIASLFVIAGSGAHVTEIIDPGGSHEYGLVSLNVNVSLPVIGQYWVGVSPVSASAVSGQFFLHSGGGAAPLVTGDAGAVFANPGEGFGLGPTSILARDFAYSISVVPEPSAAGMAILGVIGCLWRRRRDFETLRKV